jgi:acyl-CoA thioesterase-1
MIGCSEPERNGRPPEGARAASAAAAPEPRTVLFVGTSLTAGLGVSPEQAFPAVLQQKIDSAGLPFRVVNAGVSGETTAGALRRLDWLLRQPFQVMVLETGANDMLRGSDLDVTRNNLQSIVDRVRSERPETRIVLVGMLAPPNLGREYARRFGEIYPEIARRNDLPLVPFLLQDVGGDPSRNQADGIHPNAAGHRVLAENVWPTLERELREAVADDP